MSSIADSKYLFRFTVFEEWQAVDQINPLWLRGDFPIKFFLYLLTQFVGHQPSITEECDFTLWLPRHELLLQDNGSRLSSILSWMNVQITEQQAVLQNIASVALSAGTSSRLRIVVVLAHLTALLLDTTDSDSNTIMTDTFENSIIRESMEAFEARSIPATRSAVEALEKFRFQQQSDSISVGECIICLEEFETGSELIRMPCSHVYHGHCILKWLHTNNSCPLCQYPMPSDYY